MKALVNGFHNELAKSKQFQPTRSDLYSITTYDGFYLHPEQYAFKGGILVIDEAHKLRNPKSKKYRMLFQVAKQMRKVSIVWWFFIYILGLPHVGYCHH